MSEQHAWVCSIMFLPYVPLTLAKYGNAEGRTMAELVREHNRGEHFDETAPVSTARWDRNTEGYPRKLKAGFKSYGFTAVTGRVRDVFLASDFGKATFAQLRLYTSDLATLATDELDPLNLGDRKQAPVAEKSQNLENASIDPSDPRRKLLPSKERADDEIVLTGAALTRPEDCSEPLPDTAFFVSDRLNAALRKARLDTSFGFTCCVIRA
jgi:hypothetical protein